MGTIGKEEIQNRAYEFLKLHSNDSDERQQAQMWIRDFLEIFDIPRQKINIGFEWRVNIDGSQKYVDHLLNGVLLIEMKSKNQRLNKAKSQAYRYVMNLHKDDIPKYILLCNFERLQLLDLLEPQKSIDFAVNDLPKYLDHFAFLLNKTVNVKVPTNPVNEQAARMTESIHSKLLESKYPKNYADLLMTRIVFCLFAENSEIFETNQFNNYLSNETKEDGSDLVDKLATLFEVLNTPEDLRYQSDILQAFPYINGGLFEHPQKTGLPLTTEIRKQLIEAATLDWSKISPVIFGSMFEGAMDENRRHSLGAHYTSEKNILKIVNSLFINELRSEFEYIQKLKRGREQRLEEFHNKLATLKFLDPASGSGNFLIVAYRELRRLEHEVIDEIVQAQLTANIEDYIKVEVNQFYGIEVVPYAVSIGKVGLWLMDHLMNQEASELFGTYYARLPLHAGASIVNADALTLDWAEVIPPEELNYILGNPPFLGARNMDKTQKTTLLQSLKNFKNSNDIDFVGGWYVKAAEMMMKNPNIRGALVSTNSIVQGEQATNLWKPLIVDYGININFAHRTFEWDNNGAVVHVVIVGFSLQNNKKNELFYYDDIKKEPRVEYVQNINQYLLNTPTIFIDGRTKQISNMPKMGTGTTPLDGNNLIFKETEMMEVLTQYPMLEPYFYEFIGAKEHLSSKVPRRYLLYLKDAPINFLRTIPLIREISKNIKEIRLNSDRENTRKKAEKPFLVGDDRFHQTPSLLIPRHSTSRREYIPLGFYDENVIISDAALQLPNANLSLYGILQSNMHMAWMRVLCGRIKSDFRYSNKIVYNTFVFPKLNSEKEHLIENLSSSILDIRKKYIDSGDDLEDLYDPDFMPYDLKKAHTNLDRAVEKLYRKEPFKSDEERVEYLIKLYQNAINK